MDKRNGDPSHGQAGATVETSRRSIRLALVLGLLPWPAVYYGLYVLHSAWAAFFLYHLVCIGSWLFARAPLQMLPAPLMLLRRRHWAALGAACIAVNATVYFLAGVLSTLLAPHHLGSELNALGVGGSFAAEAALFAYFGLVNPIVEELFWRQTVFAQLRQARWSPRWAAIVSGGLFGAWHWLPIHLLLPQAIAGAAVAGVAVTGVLFALLYERLRSLHAVALLHAFAADVPILVAVWVDVLARR